MERIYVLFDQLAWLQDVPIYGWMAATLFGFLLLATWYDRQKHFVFRFEAARRLKRLSRIPDPRDKFLYLRSTHHFTFEEMILTALKRQGHKIVRNRRYTGDGGIDGKAIIKGQPYLVQAKRYSGHIDPAHVSEFARICRRHRAKGLFVHTGKTGQKSWQAAGDGDIKMISGAKLLKLFAA